MSSKKKTHQTPKIDSLSRETNDKHKTLKVYAIENCMN